MAKILLRSGYLDDFLALGENGQAVFDSAFQIRETLRLRKQHIVADTLAIPQPNDEGDRVDWYAPQDGNVIGWAAASKEQRRTALRYLDTCLSNVAALSARCQQAEKTSIRLFGALLENALQFPASQHVYLVDGKPVITFWGFVNLNQSAREDVLECLRVEALKEPEIDAIPEEEMPAFSPLPVVLTEPEKPLLLPPLSDAINDDSPVYTLAPLPSNMPEPEAKPVPQTAPTAPTAQATLPRRWLIPTAVLAVAVVITAGVGYGLVTHSTPAPLAADRAQQPPQLVAPRPIQPVAIAKNSLPLKPADVMAPPKTQPAPAPVVPSSNVPKNALILPADALKMGSTHFLNGGWRAQIDVSDPIIGKAPSLHYQISGNKGSVRLLHGNGIVCKAEVFSGLHQSGALMIKTRGSAHCSDGTRYPMPEVTCKTGNNGAAVCTGRYTNNTVVPITFRKVSN